MRIFYFLLIFLAIVRGSLVAEEAEGCAFCNPVVLERQTFYQDDLVSILYTHKPIFEGHCLVIPNRHVERYEDLTKEERDRMSELLVRLDKAVKKVFNTDSHLLLQKNGKEVGQTVPHVHIHYIPRQEGDDSTVRFIFNAIKAQVIGPIKEEEMHQIVIHMQEKMDE